MRWIGVATLAAVVCLSSGCAGKPYQVFAVQVAWAPKPDATAGTLPTANPPKSARERRLVSTMEPRHPQWDLNHALSADLAQLPGADAATVAKIVAGRPYGTKRELVSRGVVNAADYARWKVYLVVHRAAVQSAAGRSKRKR